MCRHDVSNEIPTKMTGRAILGYTPEADEAIHTSRYIDNGRSHRIALEFNNQTARTVQSIPALYAKKVDLLYVDAYLTVLGCACDSHRHQRHFQNFLY
jgi:hypothetical protein